MEFTNIAVRKEFELHATALKERYQAKYDACDNGHKRAGATRSYKCDLRKLEAQFKVYDEACELPIALYIVIRHKTDSYCVRSYVGIRLRYASKPYDEFLKASAGGVGWDKDAANLAHLLNNCANFKRALIEIKHGQDRAGVPDNIKLNLNDPYPCVPYFEGDGVESIIKALEYLGYSVERRPSNSYFLRKE